MRLKNSICLPKPLRSRRYYNSTGKRSDARSAENRWDVGAGSFSILRVWAAQDDLRLSFLPHMQHQQLHGGFLEQQIVHKNSQRKYWRIFYCIRSHLLLVFVLWGNRETGVRCTLNSRDGTRDTILNSRELSGLSYRKTYRFYTVWFLLSNELLILSILLWLR